MDFAPEKSASEVDEAYPSWLGGEGTGGEGAVEETDGEVILLILASEKDEPTLVHAVVDEELLPPAAKVAHPLAVVVDLDAVRGLAAATFPQLGASHLLVLHRARELGREAETIPGTGKHRNDAGGPSLRRDVGRRLERRFLQPGPRWA
jgi:hypothetical protein